MYFKEIKRRKIIFLKRFPIFTISVMLPSYRFDFPSDIIFLQLETHFLPVGDKPSQFGLV